MPHLSSHSLLSGGFPQTLGCVTLAFAAVFLILLILLHFLKPEFSPVWRMISEYEIGRFGWMMRVAFFCWGTSLLTLLILLWPSLGSVSGTIGRWWFALIASALFGAGIFITNPITENNPTPVHILHTICGAVVILTFPMAATLVVNSLSHSGFWPAVRGQFITGTVLAGLGMIAFFASILISRLLDPSAGRVGPKVYQGWPNRFLVFTYVLWLMIAAVSALQILG